MAVMQHDGGGPAATSASWWPGLEPYRNGKVCDPDLLEACADRLQGLLDDLLADSAGTFPQLHQALPPDAMGGGGWFGQWATAQSVETSYRTATVGVLEYYEELIEQLRRTIGQLKVQAAEERASDLSAAVDIGQHGY